MRLLLALVLAGVAVAGWAGVPTAAPDSGSRIGELVGRDAVRCGTFRRLRPEAQELTVEEHARHAGTINYELTTALVSDPRRAERRFVDG